MATHYMMVFSAKIDGLEDLNLEIRCHSTLEDDSHQHLGNQVQRPAEGLESSHFRQSRRGFQRTSPFLC